MCPVRSAGCLRTPWSRRRAGRGAAGPAKVDVVACDGLDAAVERGFGWARPDGVVLLSPAAPSFGAFRNYADRGAAFARAMNACRV